METKERPSVYDINELARQHTPGYALFERRQIEDMRESLARYGLALSKAESEMSVMMTRLLRVVEAHDAARARKDYATSDAIRQALDVSYPFDTTPAARRDAYRVRFDVPMKKGMVHFVATPPRE
jgi:hypothetical protein